MSEISLHKTIHMISTGDPPLTCSCYSTTESHGLWTRLRWFARCTNMNQYDIEMTASVDVSKGQTVMSHKGELQTLTKQSMRHQVCSGETCCTNICIVLLHIS